VVAEKTPSPSLTWENPESARVLSPAEHPISNGLIDPDALFVMKKLNRSGFCCYLVGGGVRDLYLGKTPKDFDISTDAKPGQIRKLFRNSATIGRRFKLVQLFFKGGKIIEVSTLRSLSEYDIDGPEMVLAPNNTFGTLDQDARRRDLTINSLFYEIEHQTIIDYVGGVADLDNSTIRVVGDPNVRLRRDPVRMMRVIRHAVRNNFSIEPGSWQAVCHHHSKLTLCPPSRLRDELFKDLRGSCSRRWFELASSSGIFSTLLPPYDECPEWSKDQKKSVQQQLNKLFRVIDKLIGLVRQGRMVEPSDCFLLALILIPWAKRTFKLLDGEPKGPALFQLTKKIRNGINREIGNHLNLRKSIRQEITLLLINLVQFSHHSKKKRLPGWLKRKKYFARANLFYCCYLEAETGRPIPDRLLAHKGFSIKTEPIGGRGKRRSSKKSRPAFSSKPNGSIFGLE